MGNGLHVLFLLASVGGSCVGLARDSSCCRRWYAGVCVQDLVNAHTVVTDGDVQALREALPRCLYLEV